MSKFTDADGREWVVLLTVAEAKRVKTTLDIDLLNVGDNGLYARLVNDPETIVDVLHVVLGEECDSRKLSARDFARALRGDVLDAASQALLEALIDFFPKRRREVLTAAMEKMQKLDRLQTDHALATINSDKLDRIAQAAMAEADRELETAMERLTATTPTETSTPGDSSSSGPATSASTPPY